MNCEICDTPPRWENEARCFLCDHVTRLIKHQGLTAIRTRLHKLMVAISEGIDD